MSSILTNTSAMVALQTLKSINSNLAKTQDEISTGKSIASARDNSAVWAISKVMESDVSGFNSISSSLSLGQSTVAVAADAADSVTDLLKDMKEKIVAAQESNVDRDKIQTDIVALRDQISSIVGAAQFNGLNLLSNRESATVTADILSKVNGTGSVDILSSLDRSSTGVTASDISVAKADLGTAAHTAGAGSDIAATAFAVTTGTAVKNGGTAGVLTLAGDTTTAARSGNVVLAGDTYTINGTGLTGTVEYVARDGDTLADIGTALQEVLNFTATKEGKDISSTYDASTKKLTITNNTATDLTLTTAVKTGGTAGGGLELMSKIDVTTDDGAAAALGAIEGLIQTSISATAAFGSAQGRIDTQASFVSKLTDSLKAGIGSLVDADMEEASARLQALQVQQQLGIQSLSIANQAPQSILSLFR